MSRERSTNHFYKITFCQIFLPDSFWCSLQIKCNNKQNFCLSSLQVTCVLDKVRFQSLGIYGFERGLEQKSLFHQDKTQFCGLIWPPIETSSKCNFAQCFFLMNMSTKSFGIGPFWPEIRRNCKPSAGADIVLFSKIYILIKMQLSLISLVLIVKIGSDL